LELVDAGVDGGFAGAKDVVLTGVAEGGEVRDPSAVVLCLDAAFEDVEDFELGG
jgi:hypothetical protein